MSEGVETVEICIIGGRGWNMWRSSMQTGWPSHDQSTNKNTFSLRLTVVFLYCSMGSYVGREESRPWRQCVGNMECDEDEVTKSAQKGTKAPKLLGKVDIRKVDIRKVDLTSAWREYNWRSSDRLSPITLIRRPRRGGQTRHRRRVLAAGDEERTFAVNINSNERSVCRRRDCGKNHGSQHKAPRRRRLEPKSDKCGFEGTAAHGFWPKLCVIELARVV